MSASTSCTITSQPHHEPTTERANIRATIVSILDIRKGMTLPGTQAEFVTRYRAIVFKPFKGEVVDDVVNNVSKGASTTIDIGRH